MKRKLVIQVYLKQCKLTEGKVSIFEDQSHLPDKQDDMNIIFLCSLYESELHDIIKKYLQESGKTVIELMNDELFIE